MRHFRTAILFSLAACTTAGAQDPRLERITIQLKWTHQFQFAGYYAAKEKGFYAELGLDVDLREMDELTTAVDAVVRGEAEYGVGDASLIVQRANGAPVVVLAQVFQQSPLVLLTLADSGITTPADLAGKSVMLAPGLDAPVRSLIRAEFVDPESVRIVPHSYDIEDLIEGRVDAWPGYVTNEPFILKERGIPFYTIQPRDYGVDHYGDNLFTSEEELIENPDRVRRVIEATIRGWRYAFRHSDEIIGIIRETYAPEADPRHLAFEAKLTEMNVLPDLVPVGQINRFRYQKLAADYHDLGLIDSPVLPEGFIYSADRAMEKRFELTPEESAWLQAHGPVRIATTDSDAPFQFMRDDGSVGGIVSDLAIAIERRLGVPVTVEAMRDPDFYDAGRGEEIDVIGLIPENNIDRTWPREQTAPTGVEIYISVFGPGDGPDSIPIEQLKGFEIGLPHFVAGELKDWIVDNNKTVRTEGNLEALQFVHNGTVDYCAVISELGKEIIRNDETLDVREVAVWPEPIESVFSVRKDAPLLLSAINSALADIKKRDIEPMLAKWYAPGPSAEPHIRLSIEEAALIEQHANIRVGLPMDIPPYAFIDGDGEHRGLFVDYLNHIAEATGIQPEIVPLRWPEIMAASREHEIDIYAGIHTEERAEVMDFTREFFEIPYVIFARQDAPFIRDEGWLSGKRVAVLSGTAIHEDLPGMIPNIDIAAFDSVPVALHAVASGKVDAYVGDSISGSYIIVEERIPNLKIAAPITHTEDALRFAVRNDWAPLVSIFNRALSSIDDQTHDAILRKWLSVRYEQGGDWAHIQRNLLMIGSLAGLVLVGVILWNRQLGRVVDTRTRELKRSQERYSEFVEGTESLVTQVDGSGVLTYVNDTSNVIYGLPPDEVVGRSSYDFVEERDRARTREWFEECVREQRTHSTLENRQVDIHGQPRSMLWSANFHYNDDGSIAYVNSIARDMTDRKKAEEDRERLMSAIEQAAEGVVITDADARAQFVNPAFERISGYSRDDILGKDMRDLKGAEAYEDIIESARVPIEKGEVWSGRIEFTGAGGVPATLEVTVSPVIDESHDTVNLVVVIRDVTHEMALEDRLRQSQKMEAVGALAGGIAHDFNNILGAVLGYAEILKSELPDGEDAPHEIVDEILNAGERARDLVSQILAFSRKSERERTPVQLGTLVREVLKLLRGALPSTIEICEDISCESETILCDGSQIHQVIMNLCTNAWQSMRESGGVLTVGLRCRNLGEGEANDVGVAPGPYLELSVEDTGIGIPPEYIGRIFEPFFTTKPLGDGTGMGLAVAHGVVQDHGGFIHVKSAVESGTTFTVLLPRMQASVKTEAPAAMQPEKGGARILFVDDEAALRKLAGAMLSTLGHSVVVCENGEQALDAFTKCPDDFDLVITDLTMPKMTGAEFASKVLSERPDIPILMCTGYSETMTPERAEELGVRELLFKPIRVTELAAAVRRALEQPTAA